MFQDRENIQDRLISQSNLQEVAFQYFEGVCGMDIDTAEAFQIYCTQIVSWPPIGYDLDDALKGFQESYRGYFGNENGPKTDFAYQFIEGTGLLAGDSAMLERYFDCEAYGRALLLEGYSEYDGYVL